MTDNFQYDVFLSHSAKDKAVVRPLAERLLACRAVVSASARRRKAGTFRFRDLLNPAFAQGLRRGRQNRRFIPPRLDDAPVIEVELIGMDETEARVGH